MRHYSHDPTSPPIVMCFSGLDPSGGAGLQADIQTTSAFSCHCAPIATALTVQNTHGVQSFQPVPTDVIEQQARAVLNDSVVSAFKLGMLACDETVRLVANLLREYPDTPVVCDPVFAGGSGNTLSSISQHKTISDHLLPYITVVTPNTIECHQLASHSSLTDTLSQANWLLQQGVSYVLVTGTHANTASVTHRLYGKKGLLQSLDWPRLPHNYHGSGCTLAAAIASSLANGEDVMSASKQAQNYTWHTLYRAFQSGGGQRTPNRLSLTGPTPLRLDKYSA